MAFLQSIIPARHVSVTPADGVNQGLIGILCTAAGTVTLKDSGGTSIQYTVAAGDVIALQITEIPATGTSLTAGQIIGYRA